MRRPKRMNSGSLNSSSSSRIWRLMADCETFRRAPAAVKEPLSAIARRISSCLKSIFGRGAFAPRTPLPAPSLAASTARSGRVAHSLRSFASISIQSDPGRLAVLHGLEERHQLAKLGSDFLELLILFLLALR